MTFKILIPASVVRHWEPKFEDLAKHGVSQTSDVTYNKVLAVRGRRTVIDASEADLREIVEECDFALRHRLRVAYLSLENKAKELLKCLPANPSNGIFSQNIICWGTLVRHIEPSTPWMSL